MTKDDVIRMARDAAAKHGHTLRDEPEPETIEFLEAFHALVAAHEREGCAKLCDLESVKWKSPKYSFATASAKHCAEAIRARGNQ